MNTILLGLLVVAAMNDGTMNGDRPIARCAGVTILYREISKDRTAPLPDSVARNEQERQEIFDRAESEWFRIRVSQLLIDFAMKRDGLQPTPAEMDAATPDQIRDVEAYRRSFEPDYAMVRAVRRVLRGEDKRKVFEEDLKRFADQGVTFYRFEGLTMMVRSERMIDEFLSKDQAAITRERALTDVRHGIVIRKIRNAIADHARAANVPLDEAKAAYWSQLLRDAEAVALDGRFDLPTWEGVL